MGALLFTENLVFKAACLALKSKFLLKVVVPFDPVIALVTIPFLFTVIRTTTIPSSWTS